jgi:Ca2+:H+ antiporter
MAGSIMGNVMLVLGCSVLLGGSRMKFQKFNMSVARSNLGMLSFAIISMIIPFAFSQAKTAHGQGISHDSMMLLSILIAVGMVVIYVLGLVFSLGTHRTIFVQHDENEKDDEKPSMKLGTALIMLAVVTGFVAWECEILIATVESAIAQFHLSEIFVGIILIPILGNVAEHASALMMAWKDKLDISIEIAVGSSMQIALFVAPVCCILSFILGNPMMYVFGPFEMIGMVSGLVLAIYVFMDGKTNWLEGILLIGSYIMFGTSFFFIR